MHVLHACICVLACIVSSLCHLVVWGISVCLFMQMQHILHMYKAAYLSVYLMAVTSLYLLCRNSSMRSRSSPPRPNILTMAY